MENQLQEENRLLRERIQQLEQEVEHWKQTLDKFKESSRFQVLQIVVIKNSYSS